MEKTKLPVKRKFRYSSILKRVGKNRHSTGRAKQYVNPYMTNRSFQANPMFFPKHKKLKGWQKENRRRAA